MPKCAARLQLMAKLEAEPEHAGLINRRTDLKVGGDAGFFHLGGGPSHSELSACCGHMAWMMMDRVLEAEFTAQEGDPST